MQACYGKRGTYSFQFNLLTKWRYVSSLRKARSRTR